MSSDPRDHAEKAFRDEGLTAETWSNQAGFIYGEHDHPYHKVLFCIAGSITFHTPAGDIGLDPGQRLDLPPGTPHSATVGPAGVTCMEAKRG
ncbi:MAG TPA: AraC family ligand binding domain-containing protein [Acidimicrobiia bacterium]|nr:AraC family ligand binding domain-containing protein [Acidimicrobiia bacterium]